MKYIHSIFLTIFSILQISCEKDLSKEQSLIQLQNCLKAIDVSSKEFNSQNPFLNELAKERNLNGYDIDKAPVFEIIDLQKKIDSSIQIQKSNISNIKNNYDDNLLSTQTISYIEFLIKFNQNTKHYMELIGDSIDGNEIEQTAVIKDLATESYVEITKNKSNLSAYYAKYKISQTEIDSLTNLNRE